MADQGLFRRELALGPEMPEESHRQFLSVDHPRKIQQVRFQYQAAAQGVHRGPAAHAEHGVERVVPHLYPRGEDARRQDLGRVRAYVGGRKAQLAPQAGALDDRAAHAVVPAQAFIGLFHPALAQVGADEAGGDPVAAPGGKRHGLKGYTGLPAGGPQERQMALPAPPDGEIRPHAEPGSAEALQHHPREEVCGRHVGHGSIEDQRGYLVGAQGRHQRVAFLGEGYEAVLQLSGEEEFWGKGEIDHLAPQAAPQGFAHGGLYKLLVAPVDPVVSTDSQEIKHGPPPAPGAGPRRPAPAS